MTPEDAVREIAIARLAQGRDFLSLHLHIDGKCMFKYACKAEDGTWATVKFNAEGEPIGMEPITNLVEWCRVKIEGHNFKCASDKLEGGHA